MTNPANFPVRDHPAVEPLGLVKSREPEDSYVIIDVMLLDDLSENIEPIPQQSAIDWAAGIVAAGMSAVPQSWAAPAAMIFGMITAPLLNKRRDEWFESLRFEVNELRQRIDALTPEALSSNEAFISVLVQASQAALRTHEPEKLEALRNAVINVAISAVAPEAIAAPKGDLELMFLRYLEAFTPVHLRVLRACASITAQERDALRRQRDLSDQAIVDLVNRGLIRDTRPYAARNRDSHEALIIERWDVSNLGRQFLDFISRQQR